MAVSALFSDFNNKININCFYVFQIVTQTYLCGRIVSQEIIRNYGKNYVRKIIKLSLFILFCAVQIHPLFAVDACVEDDSVAIILNTEQSVTYSYSGTSWYISNGIRGTSACLTSRKYPDLNKIIDNGVIINGGEATGNWCWCRIIYPVVTKWLLDGWQASSPSGCQSSCAGHCGYSYQYGSSWFRPTIHSSIEN